MLNISRVYGSVRVIYTTSIFAVKVHIRNKNKKKTPQVRL